MVTKKKPKTPGKRSPPPAATKAAGAGSPSSSKAPAAIGGESTLKSTKRKPGRPKKGEAVTTPEILDRMGQMWLQSHTHQQIADEVGLDRSVVTRCINDKLKPIWREHIWDHLQEDILKTAEIERAAWEKYRASKDPLDLAMAKWAIEHRAKVAGHFAPTKLDIKQHAQVRVAGKSPAEFDNETMEIILKGIVERRRYEAILAERGVEV